MTENNFEFKDTLSYESPEAPDCLIVPEAQWDELYNNLKETKAFRDNLLWMLCGVCGGGTISCWATYYSLPSTAGDLLKLTFCVLGVLLPILTILFLVLALKLGSEVTAESVREQMSVLKKGFRKLTASS
ncbi:MAG: PspC domain-containing protein [Candidatus Electrothrix sp. AUS3]|nr:PspC domain-containing protein [Candidatus Electrothrix gigas]